MRGIYFPLLAAALMYSCADGFTKEEHDIIGSAGEGVMRLYVVDNESDSSLLRRKALPVSQEVVRSARFNILKERMLATVNDTINPGVGIAAPQVGISRSLIAVQRFDKEGEPFEFYINPEIVYYSEQKADGNEGCLSVPGLSGIVPRSVEIVVRYTDETSFIEKMERVSGFTAVIFQHETDHLNGVIFTDRAQSVARDQVND